MMNTSLPIKNIMTKKVISVFPEDSFEVIETLFSQNNFHHIPVIEKSGAISGIISKEDWRSRLETVSTESTGSTWTSKYLKGITAEDVMTPNPMVLDPDDTIGLAADIFLSNKFHALPIVDDQELVGILTTHDLLAFAFQ